MERLGTLLYDKNKCILVCFAVYKLIFPIHLSSGSSLTLTFLPRKSFLFHVQACYFPVPTPTNGVPTGLSFGGSHQLCPVANMSQVVLSKGAGGKPAFCENEGLWGLLSRSCHPSLGEQKCLMKERGCLTRSRPLSLVHGLGGSKGDVGRVAAEHSSWTWNSGPASQGLDRHHSGSGALQQLLCGLV